MKAKLFIMNSCCFLLVIVSVCLVLLSVYYKESTKQIEAQQNTIASLERLLAEANDLNSELTKQITELEAENQTLRTELHQKTDSILQLNLAIDTIKAESEEAIANAKVEKLSESEYKILAKLLFCEAGAASRDGLIYTCSAILNLRDYTGRTIMEMAHDKATFSVAPIVDSAKPTERVYEAIDYVLQGHRVPDICFFRTNHYHNFGVAVCEVGGHYFSRPN